MGREGSNEDTKRKGEGAGTRLRGSQQPALPPPHAARRAVDGSEAHEENPRLSLLPPADRGGTEGLRLAETWEMDGARGHFLAERGRE